MSKLKTLAQCLNDAGGFPFVVRKESVGEPVTHWKVLSYDKSRYPFSWETETYGEGVRTHRWYHDKSEMWRLESHPNAMVKEIELVKEIERTLNSNVDRDAITTKIEIPRCTCDYKGPWAFAGCRCGFLQK